MTTPRLLPAILILLAPGCEARRGSNGGAVDARPAAQRAKPRPAARALPASPAARTIPKAVFGFRLGMTRDELLAALKPRFDVDRANATARRIRANGKLLGTGAGAAFHLEAGKLVRFTLSPQVTGEAIAGRMITQSAVYAALVKELGGPGTFKGGASAGEAQFGQATWERGDTSVTFSLDGGHHDRSGRSFVQALVMVGPAPKP